MRSEIEDILGEYPTMSLKDINTVLQKRLPEKPKVSDSCIGKNLDGMMYSMKKVRSTFIVFITFYNI